MKHPTPNTQRPTPNAQRPTPNAQHPTPNAQHPTPNTQHSTPNTQHPTPNAQHPTPNTQHSTPNTQRPTPNTQHPTPNIQRRRRRGGEAIRVERRKARGSGDPSCPLRDVRCRRQPGAGLPSGRQVYGIANGRGEGTPAPGLTCWMLDVGCWVLDVGCWVFMSNPFSATSPFRAHSFSLASTNGLAYSLPQPCVCKTLFLLLCCRT
jgi:hypothetical protein